MNRIEKKDGYTIYIRDAEDPIPLFCPVCDCVYETSADERSHIKFKCCAYCAQTWAYANSKKWIDGWRPSKEDIRDSVYKRPKKAFVVS